MSQTRITGTNTISSAVWVEPDSLYVRLEMGTMGRMRFAVSSTAFTGTPLEGWSAGLEAEHQWRAISRPRQDGNGEEVVWSNGSNGAQIREQRMIDLLLVAREDMTTEDRTSSAAWGRKYIILEQALHIYGAFGILDDLALRVSASRRQFNTRLVIDEQGDLLVSAVTLDDQMQLLFRANELGVEYELLEMDDAREPSSPKAGLWGIQDIHRESHDSGFHEALDQFLTLAPPPVPMPS